MRNKENDEKRGPEVVSLGSLNIDHTIHLASSEIDRLDREHEVFPSEGETRSIDRDELPEELADFSYDRSLGGKGANQAVAAAKAGSDTSFLGAVGKKVVGIDPLLRLSQRGVETSGVESVSTETGKAYVFVGDEGENRILILEGANGYVDRDYVDSKFGRVMESDCLLLQNEIPAEATECLLSRLDNHSRDSRPTVVLDPAPVDGGTKSLLGHESIDFITPNEHEYAEIRDSLDHFSGTVVQTLGSEGATVVGGSVFPPPEVDAVDTTGAGDTFNGYLASALGRGDSLEEAVERAVAAASLSTESKGTQCSIPERDDVDERFGQT